MKTPLEWKSFDFTGTAVDLLDLFSDEPFVFLLESSLADPSRGRYSFLGFDPFAVFQGTPGSSLEDLKKQFQKYSEAHQPFRKSFSPFSSGLAGFLGYEFGLSLENIQGKQDPATPVPPCFFGFYDCILTVDHFTDKLYLSSSGLPERDPHLRQVRAHERLCRITKRLEGFFAKQPESVCVCRYSQSLPFPDGVLTSNFTKEEYLTAVRNALEYIRQGDIYQVNLAQQFCFNAARQGQKISPVLLYRRLRDLSPSCFGGYFDCGNFQIVSSSPERFLRLEGDLVQTRPMKGTRPRGRDAEEDRAREKELLMNEKEKAELLMITDLERNDLGRVCGYGTVRVKEMRTLEKYETVFQATSTVEGRLRKGQDCFDLLKACFPGGSITGCPKIRAMKIIEELEPSPRSIYTGSLGYIDFSGNMDFNILIRTLVVQGDKISFHVGGGIVADSNPEDEYRETLVKATAMRECLMPEEAGQQPFAREKTFSAHAH